MRYASTDSDAQGRFQLNDVGPGRYFLEFFLRPVKPKFEIRARKNVELLAGTHKEVRLGDDLGSLTLSGQASSSDGHLYETLSLIIRPQFPWKYSELRCFVTRERDGRFAIGHLKPGRYRVELLNWRHPARKRVELPPIELKTDLERNFQVEF